MLDATFLRLTTLIPSILSDDITMDHGSESLAFEPTPAIAVDDNTHNVSSTALPDISNSITKEVHFSSVDPISRRAQSLATTVPLLEPVSSASQLPRQKHHPKGVTSLINLDDYIQQSRDILQAQRVNFERERELFREDRKLFDAERRLWGSERALLQAKILELEATVNKSKDEKRSYSDDSTRTSIPVFRSERGQHPSSITTASQPPIWEGRENLAPATRVFSEPTKFVSNPFTEEHSKHVNGHLPSISEDGSFPVLTKEISPNSLPPERAMTMSIPIDRIDKSLDGIRIKSTALAPSFVARVITPEVTTPQGPPSPSSKALGGGGLKVGMDKLLSPFDEKLTLHAGHTPMAIVTAGSTGTASSQSTEISTPIQEKPIAPVSTAMRPPPRPSEKSDSYFSTTAGGEKETEDPELTGPLALSSNNEHGQSNAFLNTLDAKLMMEAKRYVKSPEFAPSEETDESAGPKPTQDDEGPRLRMKNSMNFGSAFGSKRCGNI